jgi:hypothetical protein
LIYFSNVLYLHFFADWWDVFIWTRNLRTLFCLTKRWQIQIIYRFTWKYIICLRCVFFKVGRLFSKLAIPKYMFVFVIKLSKEKTYFMYGWTWEIEHTMYRLLLTWVSVGDFAPYFHSSVSNVNFVLWRGGLQKYFLFAQMSIQCWFKCRFCSYLCFWFWDISPYWSLA